MRLPLRYRLASFVAATALLVMFVPLAAADGARTGPSVQPQSIVTLQSADASEVEAALDLAPGVLSSVDFGASDSQGYAVFTSAAPGLPTRGNSYVVLSSGATSDALLENSSESTTTVLD